MNSALGFMMLASLALAPEARAASLIDIFRAPKTLVMFRAKEYCSCRFIALQSDEYCRGRIRKNIPVFGVRVDEAARAVTAGYFITARARYVSARFGCDVE